MGNSYRGQEQARRQYSRREQEKLKARRARKRKLVQTVFLLGIVLNLILSAMLLTKLHGISGEGRTVAGAVAGEYALPQTAYAVQEEVNVDELEWLRGHASLFPDGKVERAAENPGLVHFLYRYGTKDYETGGEIAFTGEERQAALPLLMQWDERWGFEEYGSSVIGITGCGPTCVSMVVLGLTKDTQASPRMLAEWATENGYYMQGTGTKWSFILDGAAAFGVRGKEISNTRDDIFGALEEGMPVIVNVGAGHFTDGGHFMVLAGVEDEELILYDPNNVENSGKRWEYEEIRGEIRVAWAFWSKSY